MFLNEGQLGQPPKGGDPNAWGAYVAALRDKVAGKKSDVVQAYNTLKKVREQVGLPFMGGAAGEGGAPDTGAWAPDLEQQAVDIMAMGTLCGPSGLRRYARVTLAACGPLGPSVISNS